MSYGDACFTLQRRLRRTGSSGGGGLGSALVFSYQAAVQGGSFGSLGGTFTRADSTTCATYIDNNGVIQTVPANIPRIQYTNGQPGLLLEGTRQNKNSDSSDYSTGLWARTNLTSVRNVTGPAGVANSACTITASGADGHFNQVTGTNLIAGTSAGVTIHVKVGTGASFAYVGVTNDAVQHRVWINLTTGATSSKDQAGDTAIVTVLGANWYRLALAFPATNTINPNYQVGISRTTGATDSQNGDTALVFGAQIEQVVSFPSSYIPVVGGPSITRAQDALKFPLPLGFTPQSCTAYIAGFEQDHSTADSNGLYYIVGSTANSGNRLLDYSSQAGAAGGAARAQHTATPNTAASGTCNQNDFIEVVGQFLNDGSCISIQCINNGTPTSGAVSAAAPYEAAFSSQFISLGTNGTGNGNFVLTAFKLATGVHTLAEMRAA